MINSYTRDVLERPRTFTCVLNHATRGRAPRGRPDLAGCLPRCVRTGGRVKEFGKPVLTLVESRTFEQRMLNEEHSNRTSGHGAGIYGRMANLACHRSRSAI